MQRESGCYGNRPKPSCWIVNVYKLLSIFSYTGHGSSHILLDMIVIREREKYKHEIKNIYVFHVHYLVI